MESVGLVLRFYMISGWGWVFFFGLHALSRTDFPSEKIHLI